MHVRFFNSTPTVEVAWEVRRRDELRALLESLDQAVADATEEMGQFRALHFTFHGGRISIVGTDPFSRARIESEWRSLVNRRDGLFRERNSCLSELAGLK